MNFWTKLAIGGVLAIGGGIVTVAGTRCVKDGAEGLIDFVIDTAGNLTSKAAETVPKLTETAAETVANATEAVADAV